MRIEIPQTYCPYNDHRYRQPYCKKITSWPVGNKPSKYTLGSWYGDWKQGELVIDAEAGDVIQYGQYDSRKPRQSHRQWGVVQADGSLSLCTMAEAARFAQRIESKEIAMTEPSLSLSELDFFEGVLGDDREYKSVISCLQLAIVQYDYWICNVIAYTLMCPPLEGEKRVSWMQVAEIVKILKGVRV